MSTLLLLLLFVLAWVVLILPKQRELRRHNALLATLAEGDEVMSGSGIYGTITAIDGDVVYLEVADGIELKVARRAVASKVAPAVGMGDDDDGDHEVGMGDDDDTLDDDGDEGTSSVTEGVGADDGAVDERSDDTPGEGTDAESSGRN